ncbi:MAG: membrane integrity-associated transporter subunit PqiC [Gemmatimonadaceae bacterium]|nr:membrane integrity-associated transporter subunit PqiC [Gemmatimonadaceae bacterium]
MLSGCFKLSRNSPAQQQYVLSGARIPIAAPASADTDGLTIGIRRIDLVPYLAMPAIVVRRGAHEIVTSQFHRWGEDLGEGINHTVAAHLTNAPPVKAVNVAPWAARSQHNFLLPLHVTRFEGVAESAATTGTVHVRTTWDIIRPFDGAVLVRGITDYQDGRFTMGDYESLVSNSTPPSFASPATFAPAWAGSVPTHCRRRAADTRVSRVWVMPTPSLL